MGLLGRAGAGTCPNLLQRRSVSRSAARRSAEYQRFFSRDPARSEPLQQIWTTFRRGPSGKGGRESDCDHDGHPDDRTGPREGLGGVVAPGAQGATTGRARASTSLNPRERTSSRRARGLSGDLAGYPTCSRTAAPAHPGRPGRRDVHFAFESAVPTVVLEGGMHVSTKKRAGALRRAGSRGSGSGPGRAR